MVIVIVMEMVIGFALTEALCRGSGLGGLCTAACLSRYGWRVLVLEQHDVAGGCMSPITITITITIT